LKQTKESGNLNILIELLLYMRFIVEPTKKKMVSAELQKIKIKAWENKKSGSNSSDRSCVSDD